MTTMTPAEAKDHLDELLAKAARGEDVMIADEEGRAYKLVLSEPARPKKRGLVGSAQGKIWLADDFDETPEGFEDSMP